MPLVLISIDALSYDLKGNTDLLIKGMEIKDRIYDIILNDLYIVSNS